MVLPNVIKLRFLSYSYLYILRALKSSMKKIEIKNKTLILKDNKILDFFEKEVTPHGKGAKIPCSSKYIGKKVYVIIKED